jgi:hypothetical protein
VPAVAAPRSASPPGSAPAGAGGGPLTNLVPRGSEVTPQQTWVDGMSSGLGGTAAQPSGPIFAWGHTGATCTGVCELLFRSDDGGRTWQHLAAQGFMPGQVLVPPTFPANPTLFAMTPAQGLLVSRDAGASWAASGTAVLPRVHAAAVLPLAPAGHATVAFDTGAGRIAVLDAGDGSVTWYALPAAITQVDSLAYSGNLLLASGRDAQSNPVTLTCQATVAVTSCSPVQGAWTGNAVQLLPVAGAPGTVAVLDGPGTVYSTTDGRHFSLVASTGLGGDVKAASARLVGGALRVLVEAVDPSAAPPAVQAALVAGTAVTVLRSLPDSEASTLLLVPGDAILGAGVDLDGSSQPGPRCSHDAGGSWSATC